MVQVHGLDRLLSRARCNSHLHPKVKGAWALMLGSCFGGVSISHMRRPYRTPPGFYEPLYYSWSWQPFHGIHIFWVCQKR